MLVKLCAAVVQTDLGATTQKSGRKTRRNAPAAFPRLKGNHGDIPLKVSGDPTFKFQVIPAFYKVNDQAVSSLGDLERVLKNLQGQPNIEA
ncbi:MAG: hypothetical protein M3Q07_22430 [Pseudobdellovibrionaceae bacterium]|nr:hypothetical protein [Pseudobdellovibrionaceae bacterium]